MSPSLYFTHATLPFASQAWTWINHCRERSSGANEWGKVLKMSQWLAALSAAIFHAGFGNQTKSAERRLLFVPGDTRLGSRLLCVLHCRLYCQIQKSIKLILVNKGGNTKNTQLSRLATHAIITSVMPVAQLPVRLNSPKHSVCVWGLAPLISSIREFHYSTCQSAIPHCQAE